MTSALIILAALCCLLIIAVLTMMRKASASESARATADSARAVAEERNSALIRRLADAEAVAEKAAAATRDAEQQLASEHDELVKCRAEADNLRQRFDEFKAQTEEARKTAEQQQKEMLRQNEDSFKVLANDIMRQHSTALREQNEQRMGEILKPLKDDIDRFREDVTKCYNTEARERFSLQEKIKDLIEANNSIGREARELATALRGNSKKQGDWGEFVLESILERSGLRKGEEFTVQETTAPDGSVLRDEAGRMLRPDVVVHYPDGRAMVIDSKVSLTAFTDYVNAEDPEQQEAQGKLHLASVVKHINELSDKSYQDYVGRERLDFVMMFIPNEGAYSAAMTLDPTLWQKAYDKRVLIVSPTQLVGSLRLISQLWSHDRQTRNAIDIAEKSGQMYDKFVGFVTDMERIEKGLTAARTAYDGAMNKLRDGRGNLITRAENLRKLGVKASKRLREASSTDEDLEPTEE